MDRADWEVVRGCHHFYTDEDCHEGIWATDVGTGQVRFTGVVGRYRWPATLILGVPYCSSCDKPVPASGECANCEIVHADLAPAQLTEVHGDPLLRRVA